MRTKLAFPVMFLLLAVAAQGQTRPALPPLAWKPKADAPDWVKEKVVMTEKTRRHNYEDSPRRIAQMDAQIAQYAASPIDPKIKSESYRSSKGIRFKSAEARNRAIAAVKTAKEEHLKNLAIAMDPEYVPDISVKGVRLRDWVEPVSRNTRQP